MTAQQRASAAIGAITFILISGVAPVASGQTKTFAARLSPVPIDLAGQATVAGVGSATATLTGNTLAIDGKFEALRTPATIARVHVGLARGARGPSIGELVVTKGVQGTVSGRIELTPIQVTALSKGTVYIQVHSEKAPDGNLWGWLLAQPQGAAR